MLLSGEREGPPLPVTAPGGPLWRGQSAAAEHWSWMPGSGSPRTRGENPMPQDDDELTDSGAPVHIDAVLIEAERRIRDLLTEAANKVPGDNDAVKQVWVVIDRMAATPAKTLAGAACKLRIVLDPEVGLAAGESGKEIPMLLDVLAVVERLTASTAPPEGR